MGNRWRPVFETSGARIYVLAVQLVSTSVTARYLGPDGRGILVAAVAWVTTFATVGYLSIGQPVFHRVAGRDPVTWLDETLGTLLAITACLTLVGWVIAFGSYAVSGGSLYKALTPGVLVVAFGALPFMLWQENGSSMLLAMGSLHVLNRVQVVAGTVSLALVLVSLHVLGWGVRGALFAMLLNPVLISSFGLTYMYRRAGQLRVEWPVAKVLLAGGAKLHLGAVGSVLAGQAAILLITNFRPPSETAFFHLAGQMLISLLIVPGAVSSVAYTLIAREGPDRAWREHRRLLVQSLVMSGLLSLVAYALAPLAVELIAGAAFLPVVPLFRILLLTVVGSTLAVVIVSQWVARGMFASLAMYGLGLGVMNVAATYVLVPRYGLEGAAWVAVFSSAITFVVNGGVALWIERHWRLSDGHVA